MSRAIRISTLLALLVMVATPMSHVSAAGKNYDNFAKCLTQKGIKMYGLFWCQHCVEQKELFGSSWQYVKYVECGVPGTRQATEECKAAGIKHTPTWDFANGTRHEGKMSLEDLSTQTGCKLP